MAKRETRKPSPKRSTAKKKNQVEQSARAVAPVQDRQNLCIRKISNGYVVSQSGYKGGKYMERETFTPTKPKIKIAAALKSDSA